MRTDGDKKGAKDSRTQEVGRGGGEERQKDVINYVIVMFFSLCIFFLHK